MKRTISIKLQTTPEQSNALAALQREFANTCNKIVPIASKATCWNRPRLHHICYYPIRVSTDLGSQMVCNAIKAVCDAFKTSKSKKAATKSSITFRSTSSVHFDKRTYSFKNGALSLYTLSGRISVPMILGEFQRKYLEQGKPKEAQLVYRDKTWFFNLVLDVPDTKPVRAPRKEPSHTVLGVDLGENVLAATSTGMLFGGGHLRHKRDCALALRRRLQRNGTKSSKKRLRKISGKEARYITHVSHILSKAIVKEADDSDCTSIAMEKLTHIRKRIKAGKRMRYRLHGWPYAQLQRSIHYKAQAAGLKVVYVNPAYTSKTCSGCGQLGIRSKHRFECKSCGIRRHSDLNASENIRRIALSADSATGTVNYPHVATA